jgi:multisubunit Na+/H+ antiporter MnhB subunit
MSREVERSASPSAPELPSTPQTLWAQHRRTVVILLVGAVALALLTVAAIFLTNSTEPGISETSGLGEGYLEEKKEQVIDVATWIGWLVGGLLIGLWARSEFYKRPAGGHDIELVQDGEPPDPD